MKLFICKQVTSVLVHRTLIFISLFFILTLYNQKGFANVYTVNNTTDGHAVNQLRGAIEDADAAGGTHTINVAAGTYTLTLGMLILGNKPQTINIVGAGAATTIISMTTGAGKDRILLINPVGTTNSPVISISGITFQNAYLTSDNFGGGAIYAGGGTAESLTVTNCAFLNNTIPAGAGGGAAIKMDIRGNLTVDNCTFTNNVSNDADGAAILNTIFTSQLPGGAYGTLIVTNSTFTGNTVNNPTDNADGGAISIRSGGGSNPFSATVNNNTFNNNSADGFGGAMNVVNSAAVSTVQIHFNRFLNNTSGLSPIYSGLYMSGAGNVNADNNWWGCNGNPVNASSTAPCNQASRDAGGGLLILTKWLQLKTTASNSPICNNTLGLGNTTTVTTSLLTNSAGESVSVANLSRMLGLPVTWTSTLGGLSGTQGSIQASGTATATFTSNGTGGTATVNAQIDNVPSNETTPARASITVKAVPKPVITPGSATTFCVGGSVILSSSATAGNQWYESGTAMGGEVNQTYSTTTSGKFTVIVTSEGCISPTSDETIVTVNVPTFSDTTAAVCNKFTWHDSTYRVSTDAVWVTTNVGGCDSTRTLHLTILSVTSNTSKTNATCYGTGSGSITVTPTYGKNPFTYRIGTVGAYVSSNTFNNLKAGKYRISILDANGCAGITDQVIITQPIAVTGTASITNLTCYGSANGTITVNPSTGVGPFMYKLNTTGTYSNTNPITNVFAGAYRVYLKDANNCEGNFVVQVTEPTKVSGSSTKTDESCPGAKNGSITVNGSGGTAPYSYRFGGLGSFTSTNTFNNLKAGSYRVYVNDANGCSGFSILTNVGLIMPTCSFTFARAEKNQTEATNQTLRISISPNPTSYNFVVQVQSQKQTGIQLRVMDVNGKTLYTNKGFTEQTYRFGESFAPGIYLIEVRQGDETKTLKAIKLK